MINLPNMIDSQIPRIVIASIVLLMGIAYAFAFFDYGYIHGDEGVALMGGWRISLGEKPYLDYLEFFPPFSLLPTALIFSVFGANFLAARLLVLGYALLLIFSADFLLSRLTKNFLPRLALAAYLIPFGVYHWPIPSHHWVVTILQLLCIAWLLQGLQSHPIRNGALAGVMAALGVFTMQDQGAYLVITLLVFFFPWIEQKNTRRTLFVSWVAGGVATTIAFMLYLLSHASAYSIFYQTVMFPLERYKLVAGNQNSLASLGLHQIGSTPWVETLINFPGYTVPQTMLSVALPLLAPIALLILIRGYVRKWTPNAVNGALVAGVLTFLGGALHRYSQTYLIWAAPMFLIVICWSLDRFSLNAKKTATTAFAVLTVCSCVYCLGYFRLVVATPPVTVIGPAGTLSVPANSTQSSMQLVLDAIEQHVPADSPLICTENNAIINFWSQRRNPSQLNFYTWPTVHTDEQAGEMIEVLKNNPDTHVLLFIPFQQGDPFAQYVANNYKVSWRAPWAMLMSPGT
jgi:hypothetical protein